MKRMAMVVFVWAVVVASACGGKVGDTLDTSEAAITGTQAVSDNPFAHGIVEVSVYSSENHWQWVCTGTLVASTWVLTAGNCVVGVPPQYISIEMANTHGGSLQSSAVREVVGHPTLDLALLLLNTPLTSANRNIFPEVASVPPGDGSSVVCFGFGGGDNSVLHQAPFGVSNSGAVYGISAGFNSLQDGDEGGPCFNGSLGSNGIQSIVGVVSATWVTPVSAVSGKGVVGIGAGNESEQDTVAQWIADMIHLDGLKWGHSSYSIINKHSNAAFDVANASLLPGVAVNQVHLNGGLNQNWYFEYTNYPFMRLVNAQSGKCLDLDRNSQLLQRTCSSATTQLFRWLQRDSTYANVIAWGTGDCVDVPFSLTNDGVRLQVFTCHSGDNQLWRSGIH